MFFPIDIEVMPPGTVEEEIAKAVLKFSFYGVDPAFKAAFYAGYARRRIERWGAKQQPAADIPPWDYDKYLRSALWRGIRKRVLQRDNNRCIRCEGKATLVHHRSYGASVMAGEDDGQLASLCEGCHNVIEFCPDGTKNSPAQKECILAEQDTRRDFPEPKIGLRRRQQILPAQWDRINHWQREGWCNRVKQLKSERQAI